MKKKYTLLSIVLIFINTSYAQVGIGTTTPNGALDVNSALPIPSTHKAGLLPPIVALTATNSFATTTVGSNVVNPNGGGNPLTGTIIYNTNTSVAGANQVTPGYYFYNGTLWEKLSGSSNTNWSLTGNAGTTAGTNFVGTTDAVDFSLKTNNLERARILSGGHYLINTATNDATSGADNIFEVLATTSGDDAINGYATGTGIGVYGTTTGTGYGLVGSVNNATAVAIYGANANATGTAIIGSGGNAAGSYYPTAGVNGNGLTTGIAGIATTVADGVGVRGNGNGVTTSTTSGDGAGVAGSGAQVGVFGHASNTTGSKNGGIFTSEHGNAGITDNPYAYLAGSNGTLVYGGYFDANQDNTNNGGGNNQGEDFAYVGVVNGNTTYKILGNGSVSTMVKDENNQRRILFAPEAPEILFQDYGIGKLLNGEVTINIDPVLSKNIYVDANHPLKVFIQLEGDCNGVYVTNKSANSFTVKELKNGKSDTAFSWQIIANRADTIDSSGNIHSKHVDVRFPVGPGPIEHKDEVKTSTIKLDKVQKNTK